MSDIETEATQEKDNPGFDTIMNINVTLSVQIGSAKMKIKDLLQLNKGTVIELNKMAGEPLDIFANNELIARGEVVVTNGNYGIRLMEVSQDKLTHSGN